MCSSARPLIERVGPASRCSRRTTGTRCSCAAGTVWAATFHPELSGDLRLHQRFLQEVDVDERPFQVAFHQAREGCGRRGARQAVRRASVRQIEVAARQGGGDLEGNPTLRTMVQKARDDSMPKDNIERAIKRGTGELEGVTYEQVNYEGYAPNGVAVYVETLTDNRNRTGSEVKNIFTRNGGSLAEPGAVCWQFERKGVIMLDKAAASEDDLMLAALDAGAEDIEDQGDTWQVTTPADRAARGAHRARGGGIAFASTDLTMLPRQTVPLDRRERGQVGAAGHRRARGARRRAERLRELRHPRRRARDGGRMSGVEVGGIRRPDFTLPGVEGDERRDYTLSEYRGRKVVLAFYPGDFTPGCTKQMCQYRDHVRGVRGRRGGAARHLAPGRRPPREVDREAATSRSRCSPTPTRR